MHFSVGNASLYVHPQSELDITNAIQILFRFVGSFRTQREMWDLAELPTEFQHLAPLVKEWAECDDELRSDLVAEASDLSLHKLIHNVAPLFDANRASAANASGLVQITLSQVPRREKVGSTPQLGAGALVDSVLRFFANYGE